MTDLQSREEIAFRGSRGKSTIETKCDVGADRTSIDYSVASEVGAGPVIKTVKVKSSSGTVRRPVAEVWVEIKDFEEIVPVSLADREGLSTNAILGRDVLQHFNIDVTE